MPGGTGILLDGSVVHYEALGRGRPVIFLHGWVGSWRYWFDSMQVASRNFHAYALDLWGFGETAHDVLNYSLEQQAALLGRFLDEMGIGKIAVIGHGLGALVGLTFAARFPQKLDRIMAVGCPLHIDALNRRMLTSTPLELVDWLTNRSRELVKVLDDAAKTDPQAIQASILGLQANNIFAAIRMLNIPCLLVYGENDPAVSPPDESFALSALMHQITFKRAGHFPMLEEAVVFERLLMKFLALDSGTSPQDIQI